MPKIINVYLSGPMYLGKEQAFEWRQEVSATLHHWAQKPGNGHVVQFDILDPCLRWYDNKRELQLKAKYIVQNDKMEIAKSHVVIVNASDPGWGTPMEQYIAFSSGKMVIAFSDCDYPSIWAIVHSHHMARTHQEAAIFLCDVAKNIARAI